MVQQGNQSGIEADNPHNAEQILQTVTQDLKQLQQGLVAQLTQELTRLHAEKARLIADIEKLQAHQNTLQSQQLEALSEQQIAQQQVWAKQLAEALASHLQTLMVQRLNQVTGTHQTGEYSGNAGPPAPLAGYPTDAAQRLLASLDTTFSSTFRALQQDLNSYQSALSQQLNRMQSLEQQGEAILEALINRLREQLHAEALRRPTVPASGSGGDNVATAAALGTEKFDSRSQAAPIAKPIPLEFPGAPLSPAAKPKPELSQFQIGLLLVLLSTAALSFHNVVVRVIGSPSTIFGLFQMGGFVKLGLGNSLLILWLRMVVVLPLMIIIAMFLYPLVWRDLKKFLTDRDRRPLYSVVGSGIFLFLSQILTYIAIGQIGPSVAITILFMYPIVTVPLAWLLFNDRPTRLRWIVMAIISLGVILAALPSIFKAGFILGTGVLTAAAAGVAFAFYLIFMQLGFKKLHPVPVSLIQFSTIFVLSSVILILPLELGVQVNHTEGFLVGGAVLGVLTLIGYLANNFGVRFMGAARASIIASSGPVVTALLAFLIIQSPLEWVQIAGIFLVTGGVTALSFERMRGQTTAAKPKEAVKPVPATGTES